MYVCVYIFADMYSKRCSPLARESTFFKKEWVVAGDEFSRRQSAGDRGQIVRYGMRETSSLCVLSDWTVYILWMYIRMHLSDWLARFCRVSSHVPSRPSLQNLPRVGLYFGPSGVPHLQKYF